MDDTYHTLETLTLKNGLHVIHSSALLPPVETNGDNKDSTTQVHEREVNGPPRDEALKFEFSRAKLNGTANTSVDSLDKVTSRSVNLNPTTNGVTPLAASTANCKYQLLVYSARDEAALNRVLQQYSKYYDYCILGSPKRLQKLTYTLAARRSKLTLRSFTVGNANLPSDAIGLPNLEYVRSSLETQLCFVFTGQGAQYSKMGLELVQYPVFMSGLKQADKVFQAIGADWSLFGMQFPYSALSIISGHS